LSGFHIIIPARYGSVRLPGKALINIAGRPMIQWVYQCALETDADSVTVATDDQRIVDACQAFNAPAMLTSTEHESGTDRIAECARRLELPADALIVNLQGDEPLTPPTALSTVAVALAEREDAQVTTLCAPISQLDELHSPDSVKVVFDHAGYALYFSRAPVPWHREEFSSTTQKLPSETDYYRHIGIYAYRMDYLQALTRLPVCQSERAERLEQLRVLHNGGKIHVSVFRDEIQAGVDNEADLKRVQKQLESMADD
jgi:3-deoxy-manno-octulosonate cytidylyltransferase (CMP-KDO synthetase)